MRRFIWAFSVIVCLLTILGLPNNHTIKAQIYNPPPPFAAPVSFPMATVGLPSIYFSTNTTTGLFSSSANNIDFTISGIEALNIKATAAGNGAMFFSFGSAVLLSTATPTTIYLDSSYSPTAGANPKFSIANFGSGDFGFGVSSGNLDYVVPTSVAHSFYVAGTLYEQFTPDGQLRFFNTVPTITSGACGTTTNGSITGTDEAGKITISGAGAPTTCTISFHTTLGTAPAACTLEAASSASATMLTNVYVSSITTAQFVITGTNLATSAWYYHCF